MSRTPNVVRRNSWLRVISSATCAVAQRGQVGVRPGVVAEGHLAGVDQRAQHGGVVGPGAVAAVREEGQAHPAVRGEGDEGGDDLGARAVVDGQRQVVSLPGRRADHAAGGSHRDRPRGRSRGDRARRAGAGRGVAAGAARSSTGSADPARHGHARQAGRQGQQEPSALHAADRRSAADGRSGTPRIDAPNPFGALTDDSAL